LVCKSSSGTAACVEPQSGGDVRELPGDPPGFHDLVAEVASFDGNERDAAGG
jgi:hypothetical protein